MYSCYYDYYQQRIFGIHISLNMTNIGMNTEYSCSVLILNIATNFNDNISLKFLVLI